jgi:hypothetical protein
MKTPTVPRRNLLGCRAWTRVCRINLAQPQPSVKGNACANSTPSPALPSRLCSDRGQGLQGWGAGQPQSRVRTQLAQALPHPSDCASSALRAPSPRPKRPGLEKELLRQPLFCVQFPLQPARQFERGWRGQGEARRRREPANKRPRVRTLWAPCGERQQQPRITRMNTDERRRATAFGTTDGHG